MRSLRGAALAAVVVAVVAIGFPTVASAASNGKVTVPTVTGPISGNPTLAGTNIDLGQFGYEQGEYFIEGTATSYTPTGTLGTNGRWQVEPAETAPYKTRIVVYRPENQADFNGTVYVEWFNVSAGTDIAIDWSMTHTQIIRSGAVYVGVSAQEVGVKAIQRGDPARYGSLVYPGDDFSYDIFSQAGAVASGKADLNPLDGLRPKRLIAMGDSQSAIRLVSYANAIQPLVHLYDGFFIHSRGGSGAAFDSSGRPPDGSRTRADLDVPVLTLETETDINGLGYASVQQKDSKRFRLWEVAGTSHADLYTVNLGFSDVGDGTAEAKLLQHPSDATVDVGGCGAPVNSGPDFAVASAAISRLDRWVRTGKAPARAPRFELTDGAEPSIARDEHGNALGGIRTPIVDAPVVTLSGEPNPGSGFCFLFGKTTAFDAATLADLYPSHNEYVKKFNASADKAVKQGYLLEPNAEAFKAAAAELPIPA